MVQLVLSKELPYFSARLTKCYFLLNRSLFTCLIGFGEKKLKVIKMERLFKRKE